MPRFRKMKITVINFERWRIFWIQKSKIAKFRRQCSFNWPPNYTGQDNNVLFSCMLLTWFLCKKQRLLFFLLFQPIVPKTTNAGDLPCDGLTLTRGELTILGQPKPDEDSFNLFVMDSSWLQDNSHGSHRGTLLESAVHYTQERPRRPRFTGSGSVVTAGM